MKPVIFTFYSLFSVSFGILIFNENIVFNTFTMSLLCIAATLISFCFYVFLTSDSKNTLSANKVNSKNANILLVLLYDLIESSVNRDLEVAKKELQQTINIVNNATGQITECFYRLTSNVEAQHSLLTQLINSSEFSSNKKVKNIVNELEELNQMVNVNKNDAIRALQFEDIVSQILGNGIHCIDNVESLINQFKMELEKHLNNKQNPKCYIEQLGKLETMLIKLREQQQKPARKAENQNDLSEGNVELF